MISNYIENYSQIQKRVKVTYQTVNTYNTDKRGLDTKVKKF